VRPGEDVAVVEARGEAGEHGAVERRDRRHEPDELPRREHHQGHRGVRRHLGVARLGREHADLAEVVTGAAQGDVGTATASARLEVWPRTKPASASTAATSSASVAM